VNGRTLQFGLLMPMVGAGLGAADLMAEIVETVQAAERAGIDLILVPEHHQGPPGSLTDPIVTSGWLLARTERICIGPGVLLAPLHHSVRLAEQTAILHEASGGRLFVGVGAGYQEADFQIFRRDRETRKEDVARMIQDLRAAWSPTSASSSQVRPQLTRPAPEIWMGAWSPWGVRTAARLADGWLADPIRSRKELREMSASYRSAADKAGRTPRITYGPVVEPVYRYYLREGALGTNSGLEAADMVLGGALDDRVICGSPSTVAARISAEMLEFGAEGCTLALRHPSGPPRREVLNAIELLGREVVPEVRRQLRTSSASSSISH
jgi:alkanesulfonate monooxygenase SsuD/methylene tetrahydromethanopterin reductase-like flavin-dependent oxidoreductase (luciferase family)